MKTIKKSPETLESRVGRVDQHRDVGIIKVCHKSLRITPRASLVRLWAVLNQQLG